MKLLVTTALLYANGEAHIGHVRSTYLPADIFVRYHRRIGSDILFVSGTDDHGTPISVEAERRKVHPSKVVDEYYKKAKKDLNDLGISFDNFDKTSRSEHHDTTQWFFKTLLAKDILYSKEVELPFCPKHKRYLPDRYVRGECPYCGFTEARGDECENCNRALAEGEIVNPLCYLCKTPAEIRKTKHWFIRLSKNQKWLTNWIKGNKQLLPAIGRLFLINQYLKKGLKDIAITRDLDWGVKIPLPNTENKRIYVWFDAPIGYIDSTKQWAKNKDSIKKWRSYWLDPDSEIIHFIGKGILFHHALFWPTILKNADYKTPNVIPAYGYCNLEGFGMSKERGWVVNVRYILDRYNPDSLRYYLTTISPLTEDADFSWEEFGRKHNNELTDTLGNFVHRVLKFTYDKFGSKIPDPGKLERDSKKLLEIIPKVKDKVEKSITSYEIRNGLIEILALAREGNRFINSREPWKHLKTNRQHAAQTVYVTAQLVKSIALLIEPYLPLIARKIWKLLGQTTDVHKQSWNTIGDPINMGHLISRPIPIFKKIDKKTINAEKEKLAQITETKRPRKAAKKEEKRSKLIPFKEFQELDLRVGKILKSELVKGSKNLIRLEVDLGEDKPRQILAGMAQYYKPEELEGKLVAVIANLEPSKFFGLESRGMILAAESGKKLAILKPDKKMPPGSKIY